MPGILRTVSAEGPRLFIRFRSPSNPDRDREPAQGARRATGLLFAVLAEAFLILVVLSLGYSYTAPRHRTASMVSVAITSERPAAKARPAKTKAETAPAATSPQDVRPQPPQPAVASPHPPQPQATPPPFIQMSRNQMASLDISGLPSQPRPAAPSKGLMGPVDHGVPGDSKRVGTAPNGQPMYAASWYREPYDEELRGYLSLAHGPGFALITCRTVPDFKVDDCVGLDEYPSGSQIQRAVLAAAWQFKVRPPQVGGISRVGDWVRIRIDYTDRRR